MSSWGNVLSNLGTKTGERESSRFRGESLSEGLLPGEISSELGRVEQRWIVDLLIADHGVHALSGNFIISELDISILALIIDGLETAVIF
jgi:hypothetical protein